MAIATYEAEMNLIVFTKGGSIVAQVGPGEIVEKALRPGYSTAPQWVRELGFGAGMGLNNIQRCADSMELDSAPGRGTHLKISIMTGGHRETG